MLFRSAGVVRSIGDPDVRLREDPVRMIRAIALAARLDFTIEPTLLQAIRTHRHEIAKSSPPRLLEEYYKILRAGSSERAFRSLADVGLLEPISAELHRGATEALWRSLAALDVYRRRFESTPDALTNAILLGSLLVPLRISLHPSRGQSGAGAGSERGRSGVGVGSDSRLTPEADAADAARREPRRPPIPRLGALPIARRDVERLRQIVGLQRRLADVSASPRAQHALAHRGIFGETLTWLEIHSGSPELVEHWKAIAAENAGAPIDRPVEGSQEPQPDGTRRRRRRRRRRRFVPTQH